jgi:hypothetical protein
MAGLFQAASSPMSDHPEAGLKQPSLRSVTSHTLGRRITALVYGHLS